MLAVVTSDPVKQGRSGHQTSAVVVSVTLIPPVPHIWFENRDHLDRKVKKPVTFSQQVMFDNIGLRRWSFINLFVFVSGMT